MSGHRTRYKVARGQVWSVAAPPVVERLPDGRLELGSAAVLGGLHASYCLACLSGVDPRVEIVAEPGVDEDFGDEEDEA